MADRPSGLSDISPTDAALVERARRGETEAFDLLVRRHIGLAHGLARQAVGGDGDLANDVVQDAFVTALERLEECRNPERFRAWLLTIVRNRAHNVRKYEARRRGADLGGVQAAWGGRGADREVEAGELRAQIEEGMKEMTQLQRRVFGLHDLEGWDHGEIAHELGISAGSSRFHLHVARKALRTRLSAYPTAWSR